MSKPIVTFGANTNEVTAVDIYKGTLPKGINKTQILEEAARVDEWRDKVIGKISHDVIDHYRGLTDKTGASVTIENLSLGGQTTLSVSMNEKEHLIAIVEFKHGDTVKAALEAAKELFSPTAIEVQ